ncbi:MAG: hypothetical protein HY922_03485 [Elusimicrobia bacterium]|nr:hypothetical protein [Elusimicrobiota bacterium]
MIYDIRRPPSPASQPWEDLLVPVFRNGRRILPPAGLEAARLRARSQLAALPPGVLSLSRPERYPVELEAGLSARREALMGGAGKNGLQEAHAQVRS